MCACALLHTYSPGHVLTQPGTPGCAFAHPPTPVRTLTQPCTPVRTPVPALAQPCTLLHAFRAATASHTSARSHTPGRALAHLCTPSHVPCTPVHPLPQRGTPVHTLAHLCTFLYTSACSSTTLHTLSLPQCSHSLAHLCISPPVHTLTPPCTLSPRCALWPSPGAVAHTLHVAPSSCSRTSLVPLPSPGRPCTLHTFLHAHTQPSLVATAPGGPLWLHTPPWISPLCPPQLVWADPRVLQGPARDAAQC